jgi:hypothetical protein
MEPEKHCSAAQCQNLACGGSTVGERVRHERPLDLELAAHLGKLLFQRTIRAIRGNFRISGDNSKRSEGVRNLLHFSD